MAKKKYDASSITIQEGTAGLRHNITMYLGELGDNMIARMGKEPRDNSYDEFIAERNTFIEQVSDIHNNVYVIADGGLGIPIGEKKLESGAKINTLQAIFTLAHAGGKMDDSAYKSSSGTHGVGAAATNAAALELHVFTKYKKKWYTQSYKQGKPTGAVKVIKTPPKKYTQHLTKKMANYGTIVWFIPDQSIVSVDAVKGGKKTKGLTEAKLDLKSNEAALSDLALINHKLEVISTVLDAKGKAKSVTYLNKKDIAQYIRNVIEVNEWTLDCRTSFMFENQDVSMAINWTPNSVDDLYFKSFVNSSLTVDGGTHVNGMRDALFAALKPFVGKHKIKAASVLMGAVGFINWRMHGAQYDSQVKDKLVSKVDKEVKALLEKPLKDYFAKNKSLARKIVKRAEQAEKAQEQLQKTMKSISDTRKKSRNAFPECLVLCPDAKPIDRELFLVEGDSAGGKCKVVRNSDYQEVFKLRGKLLNCLSATIDKVFSNDVVQNLTVALGVDLKDLDLKSIRPQFDITKFRVNTVNVLTDADADGLHIAVLISTFFYRFCPDFIKEGRLRFVQTPLFITEIKGEFYGAMTREELKAEVPKGSKNYLVTRAKGLGELDEPELEKFAFAPETRIEVQLDYFEDSNAEMHYRDISSESPAAKRRLLGIE